MEIIRESINMNHICGKASLQITLNDDINVPDNKPDIYKKIIENGEIIIENLRLGDEKAGVSGKLKFNLLYHCDGGGVPMECIEGNIGFNETINIQGVFSDDSVKCIATLEDLSINLINSRKISVSAIVSLVVYGEATYSSQAAARIEDESSYCLKRNLEMLALIENKRDILRIREQHELPSNKPNVGSFIYMAPQLRNVESRAAADELQIKGEIYVFSIYLAEDMADSVQFLEEVLPFMGKIPLQGAADNMIADVNITPSSKLVSVKPDKDGEPRVIEAEMVLDLDIKLYEEQNLTLITDVYSTKKNLSPVFETAKYDSLLVHNQTRCRLAEKFKLGEEKESILQIINSMAMVNVDEVSIVDDGLFVEGAVKVNVMYISSNDNERIGCIVREVPFSQRIDASGISESAFYTVKPAVEQLNSMMLGGDELEVKIVVELDALVLNPDEVEVITDIKEGALDYNELRKLPGMCGCIVKQGDTLWDIAKAHHTTVDKIMQYNNLSSDTVKPGMKLLIIKEKVC